MMGLFRKKHIKITKVINQNRSQYFLDYVHLEHPMEYITGLIRHLAGDGHCLMVIDSSAFYIQGSSDKEERIRNIRQELAQYGLKYAETVTREENEYMLLGMKRKSKTKENFYKIGVIADMDKLVQITASIAENNALCYLFDAGLSSEEVLDSFTKAKGSDEALEQISVISLYYDTVFRRIRVQTLADRAQETEEKINCYTQQI